MYVEFCLPEIFKYRASALKHLLQVTQDNLGKHHHHQTQNYTNRRSKAPKKVLRGCVAVLVDIEWRLLESVCV